MEITGTNKCPEIHQRQFNREQIVFLASGAETSGLNMQKSEVGPVPCILYKK